MKNSIEKLSVAATGLLATSNAFAAISYSGTVNLTLTYTDSNTNGTELYIDFEGLTAAIQTTPIANDDIFIADYSADDFSFDTPESSVARSGTNLLEFSFGQSIGSGANFGAYGDVLDGSTFDTSTGQYAGVLLDTGNYGWMQISFDSINNEITLIDFAYEDSGAAISAGDTGVIPEPAEAAVLASLLAGAAAAYRRRRTA